MIASAVLFAQHGGRSKGQYTVKTTLGPYAEIHVTVCQTAQMSGTGRWPQWPLIVQSVISGEEEEEEEEERQTGEGDVTK